MTLQESKESHGFNRGSMSKYHGKEECFYLCKEDALPEPHILVIGRWKVEEFLEDKRKQDFRNYLNGVSGNRA